jgi:4-hydroxybenzoate polyprenyltransferase
LFLGLALVKRVTELLNVISVGGNDIPGRAYKKNQLTVLSATGILSSGIAISIFAFYISAPETTELYDAPLILWAILPLLICLFYRIWKSTLTFKMNEDPVIFALTDRLGQLIVLACGGLLWLAS